MRIAILTILLSAITSIHTFAQWQKVRVINAGNASIYGLASNDAYVFVGTTDSNMLRSSDNGLTWEKPSPGIPSPSKDYILLNHKGKLFVGMRNTLSPHISVYTSTDNGTHWEGIPQGDLPSFTVIRHISIDENDSIYVCGQSGMGMLRDSGWARFFPSPDDHSLFNLISKDNVLYLSDLNIYRSTDRGASWNDLGASSHKITGAIYAGDRYVVAGVARTIRRKENDESVWTQTIDSAIDIGRTEIIVPVGNVLFAGTWHGVWRSTDDGVSWSSVNMGLRSVDTVFTVLSMTVHNGMMFIGTEGQGLWNRPLAELLPPADVVVTGQSFASIHLSQSYPNPAAQDITIEYSLPRGETISLKLYDSYLNEIMTLAQGREEAGAHRVTANVRSLASGVYFYRLKAGSVTITQRMLVTR